MSQFPQVPPPGAYVPPTEHSSQGPGFNPQQSQYSQQSQAPSPYQPPAPTYGKSGSKAAFGQMFNQAVTTGKPMLNKLGKTLNSKLGSKSHAPATPQHLQSYQSYQQHQQQHSQAQGPSSSPQPQQQQWNQPQQQQQSTYNTPQQSPYAPSNYATPSSGHSGQSNYFGQHSTQPASLQTSSAQQQSVPSNNSGQYPAGQLQGQSQHGHFQQGQLGQQGQTSQAQYGQAHGQQSGVVGASHSPVQNANPTSPHPSTATTGFFPQSDQQHQYQQSDAGGQNMPPPPQQPAAAPALPVHPNQQQFQQQQQQQWAPMSPISPQAQPSNQVPPPVSPPPGHITAVQNHTTGHQPTQSPHPIPVPQSPEPQSGPTEFVAELPADLGNLSLVEKENAKAQQAPQYQAYQIPNQTPSPSQSFTIPRRAVSMSSPPLADPWRIADPSTELPTREFYIIADVIFDAMDRQYEPQNTGLLEASKILQSMKVLGLPEEVAQLFLYSSYTFFARLWALEGVPHVMVPCAPQLTPTWNFSPQSHGRDVMQISAEPPHATAGYPSYMPALNRAGWYRYFFAEQLAEGDYLEKLLCSPICRDVYKPSLLNQPDVAKWDRTETPSLANRARALRAALPRVCDEVAAEMGHAQNTTSGAGVGAGAASWPSGGQSFSTGAGNAYVPRF